MNTYKEKRQRWGAWILFDVCHRRYMQLPARLWWYRWRKWSRQRLLGNALLCQTPSVENQRRASRH